LVVQIGAGRFRAAASPGVVGYEGHGVLFTKELNAGLGERIGLVVTQVWHRGPVPREDRDEYGFAVVTSPEQMIGKVDGVFIAETLPFRYPELAAPFIKAGVRTFLNRPLAASAEEAARLIKLGRDSGNPVLAASALAVDPRVLEIRTRRGESAPLKIVNVTGPSDHFWNYVPHLISALVSALVRESRKFKPMTCRWTRQGFSSGTRSSSFSAMDRILKPAPCAAPSRWCPAASRATGTASG